MCDDRARPPGTDQAWAPLSVAEVHDLSHTASFRWYIAGGHALELATGRSWREHDDLDVGVFRGRLHALHHHLIDWDLHVAVSGHLFPWDGRPLSGQRQENNIWVRRTADTPWAIDITVGGGDDDAWWSRRDATVRLPWEEAVRCDASGVPYLAPHVQLLVKAQSLRPKDNHDAEEVIPALTGGERNWLARHVPAGHPWQRHLHQSGHAG